MAEHKRWAVSLVVTSEHDYDVLARTPEEAINLAEGLFEDGDMGSISGSEIEMADAISGGDDWAASEGFELEEEILEP